MKLSKVIRKAQHELMYPIQGYVYGDKGRAYSCEAVYRVSDNETANAYSDMLLKYGFVHYLGSGWDLGDDVWRDRGINNPEEVTQQFRLHMMELMACIAEDEGN